MKEPLYTAEKILRTAINRIISKEPFWARLVSCLKIEVVEGAELIVKGVNIQIGKDIIHRYSESNLTQLNTEVLESLVLGNTLKIALMHSSRGKGKINNIWNAACNLHVCHLLNNMKYKLPAEIKRIHDELNITDVLEEEIYNELIKNLQENDKKQGTPVEQHGEENKNGKGGLNNEQSGKEEKEQVEGKDTKSDREKSKSNQKKSQNGKEKDKKKDGEKKEQDNASKGGGEKDKGEKGVEELNSVMGTITEGNKDELEGENQGKEEQDLELMLNQILLSSQKAGDVPDFFKESIKKLRQTNFSLEQILENFIVTSIEPNRYNWQRGNRRYMRNQIFYPTMHCENIGGVILAFDSSGSCWETMKEVLGIAIELKNLHCGDETPVNILYCDTEVHHQLWRNKTEILQPTGKGGTSYAPVMRWVRKRVEENPDEFTTLLYITDGECYDYGIYPGIPVTWLILNIFNISEERLQRIPHGKKIIIPKEQLKKYVK